MADAEEVVESKRGPRVDPTRHPRSRIGKTQKDRAKGAQSRTYANRQARADWQNNGGDFPYAHCNGKRNRTVFTGKGNVRIVLSPKSKPGGKGKR
jgi:hypothetical protein